jgi:hypothetical protein
MIGFAGILSVSLTALANRNLLLVSPVDPTGFLLQQQQQRPSDRGSRRRPRSTPGFLPYDSFDRSGTPDRLAQRDSSPTAFSSSSTASSRRSRDVLHPFATNLRSRSRASDSDPPRPNSNSGGGLAARHLTVRRDPGAENLALLLPRSGSGTKDESGRRGWEVSVALPAGKIPVKAAKGLLDGQDRNLYASSHTATSSSPERSRRRRVVVLHDDWDRDARRRRKLHLYPPDITDPTQLYPVLDSSDERAKTMERRPPLEEGECVPMQEWQTTYYPSCNQLHESVDVGSAGVPKEKSGSEFWLFGTKGYWRNAWRVKLSGPQNRTDTLVLKTIK